MDTRDARRSCVSWGEAQLIRKGGEAIISLRGADCRGALLSGVTLADVDLSEVDLSGAVLSGANLKKSDLTGAVFKNADLERTVLEGAVLRSAVFDRANCYRANLHEAHLQEATPKDTILDDADLSGGSLDIIRLESCHLRRANLCDTQCHEYGKIIRCDLREARLMRAVLADVSIERSRFKNAHFNTATQWPGGRVPEGAVNIDTLWRKRAKEVRGKSPSDGNEPLSRL